MLHNSIYLFILQLFPGKTLHIYHQLQELLLLNGIP